MGAYPPVKQFIKHNDIKEIPIVVYCANDKCSASSKLREHLFSCGFYNVLEYPGGIQEWLQKSNKVGLFDDAKSVDDEDVEVDDNIEEDINDILQMKSVDDNLVMMKNY